MTRACIGLLLAAGQGRRFGGNKLLQPLDDGTPMVLASASPLHAVLTETVAVVDDADGEVARLLAQEGLQVVCNPQARKGMGTSIACGVAASRHAGGWVIALGDMPFIPQTIVQAVVAALAGGADIVAPVNQGQRGHPVGFSARHAEALMNLRADEGARGLIAAHRDSLELIEVDDRGVLLDIDHCGENGVHG
jgi:molybdenum cofactor cytidylyltransferase